MSPSVAMPAQRAAPGLNGPIFYLAPEIPSASETFVSNEIVGLLKLGVEVHAASVHRPKSAVEVPADLAGRVRYLYSRPAWRGVLAGFSALLAFGRHGFRSLGMLFSDMKACGLSRPAAWKLAFQFLMAARLARDLKAAGCVHLHVHFADVPAQLGMYAAHLAGIPFTVTAHANDIFDDALLLERKAGRAARMLTISEYNKDFLIERGVPAEKLAVVRCAVDRVAAHPAVPFERRAGYRIGTLGRLVEKKGMDVLLRAFALLPQRPYSLELVIGGDGPLRSELEALAAALGLSDKVRFAGAIRPGDVAEWMRGLDLFVLACKQDRNGDMDGIPVVLMEAMAQHVPVVSTRLSGIPELVIHDQTGLLAQPADPHDLAKQIDCMLEAPPLRQRLTQQAAAHVEREFSRNVNLMRLIKAFGLAAVSVMAACELL